METSLLGGRPLPEMRPTKERVRRWMGERSSSLHPPPSAQEIRRQLGWNLIKEDRMSTR